MDKNVMKTSAYESLYTINAATQQITEHIDKLKTDGLLTQQFAELSTLAAQLTCAEACHSAILSLAKREQVDAARIEKERKQRTHD